jgi:hypothetical protein
MRESYENQIKSHAQQIMLLLQLVSHLYALRQSIRVQGAKPVLQHVIQRLRGPTASISTGYLPL